MAKKIKITFTIPKDLQVELREQVIQEGYGFRGKSKWVSEAIQELIGLSNFPELVSYNEHMKGFDKVETIVIEYSLKIKLEEALLKIRAIYPSLEGIQSRIIRTAVLQRLIRGT